MPLSRVQAGTDRNQASRFYRRERRLDLSGVPNLHRTHEIRGAATLPVATINMGQFTSRSREIVFATKIRITANAGQHRGLIFELGGTSSGVALWVEDNKIGARAGAAAGSGDEVVLDFDTGAELAVGRMFSLVLALRPGTGEARLWDHGNEIARGAATNATFNTDWAGGGTGSFAAAFSANIAADVPAASQGAPAGFDVIAPLSVYAGQSPRNFT